MKKIKENGDSFLILSKAEFEKLFFVGCLCDYRSNGGPKSKVKIKIYGYVPNLKYCVFGK